MSELPVGEPFASFLERSEAKLRHAFVARYGPEVGRDVASEALSYGWENWGRVGGMKNPAGYLFRVGQSRARRYTLRQPLFPAAPAGHDYEFEPGLANALSSLSDRQRLVVVLVYSYGWLLTEVADLLDIGLTTVQKHEERGLLKLRRALGVDVDV